jgi:hypothetical protein
MQIHNSNFFSDKTGSNKIYVNFQFFNKMND